MACTSGALVIGEQKVADRVREARPGMRVTDPVTAARAALDALAVKRIALLTPYVRRINESLGFQQMGHLTEIAMVKGQKRGLVIWGLRIPPRSDEG